MTQQRPEDRIAVTFGSPDVVARWRRGEALRAQALGPATEQLLDLAGLTPGMRILDVAAGTGEQTLIAARRVGPSGSVLAIDIAAPMLEVAAEAAREAGLTNVKTRVMDARSLDLDDASFDAAISRMGLMLMPDRQDALRGIYRALTPGAKFGAMVFSSFDKNPYFTVPATIVRRIGHLPAPPPGEPGMFALGAPGAFAAALRDAGFQDIQVHAVSVSMRFPSAAAALELQRQSPALREVWPKLSTDQQAQATHEIEHEFQRFEGSDGFAAPGEVLVGVGTK
ncbi:MAG: methyltransferase domain-containing protein [Chloroflexi bacterium]|nr:methyltransferase domain-containing protein [Chloroflexota bacterium]